MSPVFSHGKLRLYLLSLLAERPRHGYEVIQALGERFGGSYVPSAGTVYPRLAKLNEEGLVEKTSEGRKTVYSITEAGRTELAAREGEIDEIETELDDSVRRLASEVRSSVQQAMQSLRAELASAAAAERSRPFARVNSEGSSRASWPTMPGMAQTSPPEATGSNPGFRTGANGDRADYSDPAQMRMLLRELEAQVNDFRQNVRAQLRFATSRARLGADVVEQVRTELARAAGRISDILR